MNISIENINKLKDVKKALKVEEKGNKKEMSKNLKNLARCIKDNGKKVANGIFVLDINYRNLLHNGELSHFVTYTQIKYNELSQRFTITMEEYAKTIYLPLYRAFKTPIIKESFINAVITDYTKKVEVVKKDEPKFTFRKV